MDSSKPIFIYGNDELIDIFSEKYQVFGFKNPDSLVDMLARTNNLGSIVLDSTLPQDELSDLLKVLVDSPLIIAGNTAGNTKGNASERLSNGYRYAGDMEELSSMLEDDQFEADYRGLRSLYVDDNKDLLEIGKTLLEIKGALVHESADGFMGIEKARSLDYDFDILLSDIEMPGMDGIDMARIMREEGYRGKIIFHSGNLTENYKSIAFEDDIKADAVLNKPYRLCNFYYAINQAMRVDV